MKLDIKENELTGMQERVYITLTNKEAINLLEALNNGFFKTLFASYKLTNKKHAMYIERYDNRTVNIYLQGDNIQKRIECSLNELYNDVETNSLWFYLN